MKQWAQKTLVAFNPFNNLSSVFSAQGILNRDETIIHAA
jgi:hypothetical protein